MKASPLALLIATLALAGTSLAGDVKKSAFHFAPNLEKDLGFSRAVRVGDTLYIAGSVGAGEMDAAIKQAYDRIGKTLEAHGLTFQNIVKDTIYTTDLERFIANREVRKRYYSEDYPASTWVHVSRLNAPELVVEIEAIAVFRSADACAK
ncbi:MAG TPA: Rid family hydrolase [Pyrinomonadaceae bacterium]